MPSWLKKKLHIPREIRRAVGKEYSKAVAFTGHHEAHAASAFFPSPFESAAVLTIDGVGEWETAVIWSGEGNRLRPVVKLDFPHSLGLLYTAFTYHAGFRVNSGEYKLMGLAPYGEPVYAEKILDRLVDLKPDGSFAMNMEFFGYCHGLTMTNRKFSTLFDGPPRQPESPITQREMNLAASIQAVTEKIMLRLANTAREMTGHSRLCMAGGVALNCVANGKILKREIFDDIWIQPAAGDAGGALGEVRDRRAIQRITEQHAQTIGKGAFQRGRRGKPGAGRNGAGKNGIKPADPQPEALQLPYRAEEVVGPGFS